MTTSHPSVGPIGDATREDLPALAFDLAWTLRSLFTKDRDSERRRAAGEALWQYEQAGDDGAALGEFVETSGLEALQSYCPAYLRFDEGPDGRFGFWPDLDSLQEDARSRNGVVKVNAGDPWPPLWPPHGAGIQYVMEVSDHGNVTLYGRNRREIWSCV